MKMRTRVFALLLTLALGLATAVGAEPVKLIALTFDDGPNAYYTACILDDLKARGAKATFFTVGKWLGPDKEVVLRREFDEGHQVGSHTFNHVKISTLTDEQLSTELSSLADAVNDMAGQEQQLYMLRPPFGDWSKRALAVANVPVIHWSVDPAQGKTVSGAEMAEYAVARATDGGIILLHDTTAENAAAVPLMIDALQAKGYEFVTVNELFRLKGVTPQNGKLYYSVTGPDPLAFDEKNLQSHWAWPYISDVSARGLMAGDGAGFRPNHPLTRAMAVTVLWRMKGAPVSSHNPGFTDVPYQGVWYAEAVNWAAAEGVVNGTNATTFAPDALMTREAFYAILARYARMEDVEAPSMAEVPRYGDDRRIHDWAEDDVSFLRALGFSSDYDVELFRPQAEITRAETAELLSWYLNRNI